MSLLAPGFLVVGVVAALGVVALHFMVTRRPRSIAFPTARFVPDLSSMARSRSIQLSDLLLLAVRVLTILFAAAALARPLFPPRRERIVRVIAADVSGAVANPAEVQDSVRALFRPGDAMIAFDTSAWPVTSPDSIGAGSRVHTDGSLSAGLVGALRAGSRVRDGADSVELVMVSPVVDGERDRATALIRKQWLGRARIVRVATSSIDSAVSPATAVTFQSASRPAFAVARNHIDTVGAVVAHGRVVIGQFERRWRFTSDSLTGARVIARWVDGEPAAMERISAAGCARSVAISMDTTGDMLLRPEVLRLRSALSGSCAYVASAPDSALAMLLASSGQLASAAQFPPAPDAGSPIARWLVALAFLLAIVEMALRHARASGSEL